MNGSVAEAARSRDPDRVALHRRALRLAWFVVAWDLIEGAVAVTAGLAASSVALVGFGIDSAIEVFAAAVVVRHLRDPRRIGQARALRLLAASFFLLAAYVVFESVRDLIGREQPDPSLAGIVLNAVALAVMVPVAVLQRRVGGRLRSGLLIAQSRETWISNSLSVTLLLGLGANAWLDWWWADPAAALVVAAVAVQSGWTTWREADEGGRGAQGDERR